jgi:hypothetical protein
MVDLFTAYTSDPRAIGRTLSEAKYRSLLNGPDDLRAMVTRLRVVLEDARQPLSGCVTDHAVAQLVKQDNDPTTVVVP